MKSRHIFQLLASLFLFVSLLLFLHQHFVLHEPWSWSQLYHHETIIVISLLLGFNLLFSTLFFPKLPTTNKPTKQHKKGEQK